MEQTARNAGYASGVCSVPLDVSRRSMMSWQCLNHLMLLHVNKGTLTTLINLADVANDFIASNDYMKHVFGTEFKINYEFNIMH